MLSLQSTALRPRPGLGFLLRPSTLPEIPARDLTVYDVILVNSSAGKDSQAMLDAIVRAATAQGVKHRIVVVHADLGRVEWVGTKELAAEQAAHYGVRFEIVRSTYRYTYIDGKKRGIGEKGLVLPKDAEIFEGDLLDRIEARRMWPDSKSRYCTSDFKRGPVMTLMTRLVQEQRRLLRTRGEQERPIRILNCMGLRADESPKRAKKAVFTPVTKASNGLRIVDEWLPVHAWTTENVWDLIHFSGVRFHYAYTLGMKRLSCVFCVFAPKRSLMIAGKHNPLLLMQYAQVEKIIGHTFRVDCSIAEIEALLNAGVDLSTEEEEKWDM